MGKLKRGKKNQKQRHNPLSKDGAINTKELNKDENTRQSKILPLINKLKSTTANDKSMALGAITVLAEDSRMRKLLLKERLISVILETCLNDSNDEIIVESYGLLRNLAIEEGSDVIKHLWRNGIWIAIETSLNKINDSFKHLTDNDKYNSEDKSKVQLLFDFTENILSLIIVIASGSQDIYESVFEKIDPIIAFILNLITEYMNKKIKITQQLFNSLLDFIYEFSTESAEFIEKLESFNWGDLIDFVQSSGTNLSKIYIEGIKLNNYEVLETDHTDKQVFLQEILLQIYNILGAINLERLKNDINTINNSNNAEKPISKDTTTIEKDLSSSTNELKTKTKNELSCIETGLDIITQIFEYLSVNEESAEPGIKLNQDIIKVLLNEIFTMLIELIKFDLESNTLQLNEKSLTCINNLIWLLLINEELPVEWYIKSIEILNLTLSINDGNLQRSVLNIIWGLIKTLGGEIIEKLPSNLIDHLLTIQYNSNLEVYLSAIGVLGSLAPIVNNSEVTKKISEFLFESVNIGIQGLKENKDEINYEIIFEGLNMMFETFSDKEYSYDYEVFVQNNYLGKLKELEPFVKDVYKKVDKNKNAQLKLKMEEAWINLDRFIQYKKSERD